MFKLCNLFKFIRQRIINKNVMCVFVIFLTFNNSPEHYDYVAYPQHTFNLRIMKAFNKLKAFILN
jgi:hypothetical protein